MLNPALISALVGNDLIKFTQLLQQDRTQLTAVDERGLSLLMYAIIQGKLPFIEVLIREGVNVNQPKSLRPYSTPLMLAAKFSFLGAVNVLLANGAEVNATNSDGNTALMAAMDEGNEAIIASLIKAGADVNAVCGGNGTPLLAASSFGHVNVMKMLIEAGADPHQIESTLISQQLIVMKMIQYLQIKNRELPEQYISADIEKISRDIDKGQCSGLSALWLWYKAAGKEEQFIAKLQRISKWGGTHLTKDLEADFQSLMNEVFWLQHSSSSGYLLDGTNQKDLHSLFGIIADEKLQKEFSFSFVLQPQELKEVLEQTIFENKMVLFGGLEHALAVIKKDGIYYFYDSNDVAGARVYSDVDTLTSAIQKALGVRGDNIDLNVHAFSPEGEPIPAYPTQTAIIQQLLEARRLTGKTEHLVAKHREGEVTSFELLLYSKDLNALRVLIENGSVESNAISKAIKCNVLEVIPDLVRKGFDINAYDPSSGNTPLLDAINAKKSALVKVLLENGADPNKSNERNVDIRPLYKSADPLYGDIATMEMLLEAGADPNVDSDLYCNPLMVAVAANNILATKMLLDYGAKPPKETDGALLARAILHDNIELLQLLIRAGLQVNSSEENKIPVLLRAIQEGKINCINILLEHAEINQPDAHGTTPLMCAMEHGQFAVAEKLIAKGAVINAQNAYGMTALTIARSKDNQTMVDKLLSLGAVETPKPQITWRQEAPVKPAKTDSASATTGINLDDLPPSNTRADL
jgi:ankyrin repeat protein